MKRSHENPSHDNPDHKEQSAGSPAPADNGFLGRWSRRKRGAEVVEQEVPDDLTSDVLTADAQLPQTSVDNAQQTDATVAEVALTDADMPDIETLNADSDFSPFFSDGVSKELRNLALKKLFFSGRFSVRDGLDDYDDDFTKFEPLGDTVTSDMKFHARRKEKARLAELEEQRLLRESEHEENADTAAEENALAENTEQEAVSEQEPVQEQNCEPEVIATEEPGQLPAGETVDENTDHVALKPAEDTVRIPEG